MPAEPSWPIRKQLRLPEFDYSQDGGYFVTVCTQNRRCLLGDVVDGEMRLNAAGRMVARWWNELPQKFPTVNLDACVIMPNHVHGIIVLEGGDGGTPAGGHIGPPLRKTGARAGADGTVNSGDRAAVSLQRVLQWFKTQTTNAYLRGVRAHARPTVERVLWQRGYYEHIVRDQDDANRIRQYIEENPACWDRDDENPGRIIGYT